MTAQTIEGWAADARAALDGLADELVGDSMGRVEYLVSAPVAGFLDLSGDVHGDVDTVIVTLASGRTLELAWAQSGMNEGLSVALGQRRADHTDLLDLVGVSGERGWQGLLGRPIVRIRSSWQVPNEGCPETLWALSLELDEQGSATVALGELRDGAPTYIPDSLVVVFGHTAGTAYAP